MSFGGATVDHQSVLGRAVFGESIVTLLWGGYAPSATDAEPLLLAALSAAVRDWAVVVLQRLGAARRGQNNPTGRRTEDRKRHTVPFSRPMRHQGSVCTCCFMLFFAWFIFYMPKLSRRRRQLHPANPGVTPAHIRAGMVLPAVLRDPALDPEQARRRGGMFGAILILAFLPWLDNAKTAPRSTVRWQSSSLDLRLVCLGLGYLGSQPPEGIYVIAAAS